MGNPPLFIESSKISGLESKLVKIFKLELLLVF